MARPGSNPVIVAEGNPQPLALNNSPEQLEPGVNKRNT